MINRPFQGQSKATFLKGMIFISGTCHPDQEQLFSDQESHIF